MLTGVEVVLAACRCEQSWEMLSRMEDSREVMVAREKNGSSACWRSLCCEWPGCVGGCPGRRLACRGGG